MKLTAKDVIDIVYQVEGIKNYNERLSEITKILTNFYNSKYSADDDHWDKVAEYENNRDKFCCK